MILAIWLKMPLFPPAVNGGMREPPLLVAIYIQWMKLESIIYSMYNRPTVSKFDIFISIMLYRASKLWSNIEMILAIGLKM